MPFDKQQASQVTRRRFLKGAAVGAAGLMCAPAVHSAGKTDSKIILGTGDYKYEVIHNCVTLPDKYSWQITHNVAVDKEGLLYVIHEGVKSQSRSSFYFCV